MSETLEILLCIAAGAYAVGTVVNLVFRLVSWGADMAARRDNARHWPIVIGRTRGEIALNKVRLEREDVECRLRTYQETKEHLLTEQFLADVKDGVVAERVVAQVSELLAKGFGNPSKRGQ